MLNAGPVPGIPRPGGAGARPSECTHCPATTARIPGAAAPAPARAVYCPAAVCQRNVLVTFDDQSPNITSQVTLPGYDNMTGVGTPNGRAFIRHLRQLDR
jgi:hypothetical protein